MSLIKCLRRERLALNADHQSFRRLEYAWNAEYQAGLAAGLSNAQAWRNADNAFDNVLAMLAAERKRVARLQKQAHVNITNEAAASRNLKGERDMGEIVLRMVNEAYFTAHALTRMDLTEISKLAHETRRTAIRGQRLGKARAENVVRELYGQNTGDVTARMMADAWGALSRKKIDQFNSAGGNVSVRADWALPQRHDIVSIAEMGFDKWRQLVIDTVDPTRMFNHDTGLPFTAAELDAALPEIYTTMITEGRGEAHAAMPQPSMALWKRRNDPRFFVFKDADAYFRYHHIAGGRGEIVETMFNWLRSINHDLALMQRFGPNPAQTISWVAGERGDWNGEIMRQAVEQEKGNPSLFPTRDSLGKRFRTWRDRHQYAVDKSEAIRTAYDVLSGAARRPVHDTAAMTVGTFENVMYANKLAYTAFMTPGDVINQAATRAFNGVSVSGMFRDITDALRLGWNKEILAELGIEFDVGLSTLHNEARDHAAIHGAAWSRWMADRAMTFSWLKPITLGLRATFHLGVMHELGRNAGTAFADLPANFRAMLQRHKIGPDEWAVIQATPLYRGHGTRILRPGDIAASAPFGANVRARPGFSPGEEVATRVMTMIATEGEAATVSGTPRATRFLAAPPGTIQGTLINSVSRLKTYTISHMQNHGFRAAEIFHRNGRGIMGTAHAAGYYVASILVPSMMFVAVGTILADVASGKDPPDVTDWRFWDRVFWRTVSLGFFQDLFQSLYQSDSPQDFAARIAGPTLQTIYAPLALGASALAEIGPALGIGEDTTNTGRQAVRTAKSVVPRTWLADTAMERLVWDNLQEWADPEAEADFRRRIQQQERDGRTGYWWEPGEDSPARGPEWSDLDLTDRDRDLTSRRQ